MKKMEFVLVCAALMFALQDLSWALPSFARQTGLPCGSCHADFPQLTPLGRQFKLGGYTMGEGNKTEGGFWIPPVAIMAIESFTHTQEPQDNTGTDLKPNNNWLFQQASVFYGGTVIDHLGAFVQATYNHPGFGPPPKYKFSWDNTDIRFANTSSNNIIYGITLNNNPTVQDIWNTTPAWSFPFIRSSLAPTPSAQPIINGVFAAHVLGSGVYTYFHNIYIEVTGYKTLSEGLQNSLGIDPTNAPGLIDDVAPYIRLAAEPQWGNNSLEFGMFALFTEVDPQPWDFPEIDDTDNYIDVGFDSQYQYMGEKFIITLRNSYIRENQDLDASIEDGLAANNNKLNTVNSQASFVYGQNFRLALTAAYFNIWGTTDMLLYAGNSTFGPSSNGWVTEIAYIPYGMDKAKIWPWANARIGLQYVWYNKFDGASTNYDGLGTDAADNNTVYFYGWLAM